MFDAHSDYIHIPDKYLFKPVLTSDIPEMHLIVPVYPGIKEGQLEVDNLCECSILTALNTDVNVLNNLATDMLTSDACKYTGIDQSLDGSIATENINREDPVKVAPFKLSLKIGQPIILL